MQLRNDRSVFGGVQVVMVGDFFQLVFAPRINYGCQVRCILIDDIFRDRWVHDLFLKKFQKNSKMRMYLQSKGPKQTDSSVKFLGEGKQFLERE